MKLAGVERPLAHRHRFRSPILNRARQRVHVKLLIFDRTFDPTLGPKLLMSLMPVSLDPTPSRVLSYAFSIRPTVHNGRMCFRQLRIFTPS